MDDQVGAMRKKVVDSVRQLAEAQVALDQTKATVRVGRTAR